MFGRSLLVAEYTRSERCAQSKI